MTDAPGSISRHRGRWRVRLSVDGKQRSFGVFDSYEAAEEALAAAHEATAALHSGVTLRTLGERWHVSRERAGVVRYVHKERATWGKHVAASDLGALPVARIRRVHVMRWLSEVEAKGLARSTVRTCLRLVIGALEHALDLGLVTSNPARGARISRRDEVTEARLRWLTAAEIGRVLSLPVHDAPTHSQGYRRDGTVTTKQRTAFAVAVFAGLRAGELWGLRWRDVVLRGESPRLHVRHSRDRATKSGEPREVPLLEPAREALEAWSRVRPGVGSALVFPALDGTCHRDGYDAGWARVQGLAKLDTHARWHDLRHTCASHLVQGTWGRALTLYEVRQWLGHGSITVTQRYAHLAPGGLHDVAKGLVSTR